MRVEVDGGKTVHTHFVIRWICVCVKYVILQLRLISASVILRGWIRKGKTSVRGKQLVEQETWKKQTRRSIISCCWKYFTPSYIIVCHPATKTNFLVSKHTPFCRQYQCVSVTFYIDKVKQESVMVKIYTNIT